ncbi:factor-independent urate hydroxylase [Bounagaea algeriensis]
MGVVLGHNQYGKAEVRMVAVDRSSTRHRMRDLTVSTSLRGDFASAHHDGDNSNVLPTDTQKNTVYAFAKEQPIGAIEDFALRLGHHFVNTQEPVTGARILAEEHPWERIPVGGTGHDHSFLRSGEEKRTTAVTMHNGEAHVVSGLSDLVVLKSTGSEFWGYPKDRYTTLAETEDRVLATAVTARWRYQHNDVDWDKSFSSIRATLLEAFATTHSLALQQTLYEMGRSALEAHSELAEVRLSLPNKHHFLVDLSYCDLENNNEVFFAADRPYGLIEGTVTRDDVPESPEAWFSLPEF